jgi:RHS repeat-associated protein
VRPTTSRTELGSTSHIASATGALIESYQYDLYGKPRVYDSGGAYQQSATPVAKDLGNGGARWIPQLGLYDDRNRFMSPDLGRFLQPDPIGFKGDSSNLYRYCGNDWANKTDPMGLASNDPADNVIWLAAQQQLVQKQMQKVQGIINQRLSLGYGATQLAGLYHSMNKLQQSEQNLSVGLTNQTTSGQFSVSAHALNARQGAGPMGASASEFRTVFTDTQHFDSYKVEQFRSDGKVDSNGNVTWGPFHSDPALTGRAAHVTQKPNGVQVDDRVGAFRESASLPGHAVISHGQLPALSFNPTAVKIKVSVSGLDKQGSQARGSTTFSGVWNQNTVPHYEGVDSSY